MRSVGGVSVLSLFVPFSLLLAGAPPLPAFSAAVAIQHTGSPKPDQPQDETDRLFEQYFDQLYGRQYADALATSSRFDPDEDNKEGQAIVKAMRAAALLGLKRDQEAAKLFAEADAAAPSVSLVSTLQFDAGLYAENYEVAAIALDRMIARMPDVARELDVDGVSFLLANEPKGQDLQNEERRVALARLGFGGAGGDYFISSAIEILVKRGEVASAEPLLFKLDSPSLVETLLIQRRYAALWTKIEARAGANLHNFRESSVLAARREFDEEPDSTSKLQLLIHVLRSAGKLDAAIALQSKLPSTPDALSSADEDTGWSINEVALALHRAGRRDEADQLFASLNEAKMKNGRWRVSMFINRLELLVSDGRFDRALPLLDLTEASAAVDGNAYARQLVRRLRYCTMSGLGRKAEAAKLLPELLKQASDAPGATIDALLCAGEVDRAEKLALASLKDEKFQADFVSRLQARPLTSDDPSIWAKSWQELRQRPAIAAEFNRLGRDMPAEFLPPAIELTDEPARIPAPSGWTEQG